MRFPFDENLLATNPVSGHLARLGQRELAGKIRLPRFWWFHAPLKKAESRRTWRVLVQLGVEEAEVIQGGDPPRFLKLDGCVERAASNPPWKARAAPSGESLGRADHDAAVVQAIRLSQKKHMSRI